MRARLLAVVGLVALLGSACGGEAKPAQGEIKAGVGVAGKAIKLGGLSPLTGPAAITGKPLTAGHEVYWKFVNANGGIDGYQIELVTKDTQYRPTTHVQQYMAIAKDVLMIDQSFGTPTTQAITDLVAQDKILVSATTLASSLAGQKFILLVGAPYRLQTENAFEYVVNKLNKKNPKTFIIYQDDDYGQDGVQGYKEAIQPYGLTDLGQQPYKSGDSDFTAQVTLAKNRGAEYVFLVTTPTETGKIIATAKSMNFKPKWLLQSPAWSPGLLASAAKDVLLADALTFVDTAEWGDLKVPAMKEMLDNMAKYAPDQKPDTFFLFGYAQASVTHAILKRAIQRRDLTRDGVLRALESIKNADLGGLLPPATYGSKPDERVPNRGARAFKVVEPGVNPTGLKADAELFSGSVARKSQFAAQTAFTRR